MPCRRVHAIFLRVTSFVTHAFGLLRSSRVVRTRLFAVGLAHLLMTFLLRERTTCEPPGRLVRSFGLDRQDARACARDGAARVAFTSPQSCLRRDHRLARAAGRENARRHASCSCTGCRKKGGRAHARVRARRARSPGSTRAARRAGSKTPLQMRVTPHPRRGTPARAAGTHPPWLPLPPYFLLTTSVTL